MAYYMHKGNPCSLCGTPDDEDSDEIQECPAALLEVFRDLKTELAFPLEQLRAIEKRLRTAALDYAEETGGNGNILRVDGAAIKVTRPKAPRTYWNTKALESYALSHPAILIFREERWSKPSIRLEVE